MSKRIKLNILYKISAARELHFCNSKQQMKKVIQPCTIGWKKSSHILVLRGFTLVSWQTLTVASFCRRHFSLFSFWNLGTVSTGLYAGHLQVRIVFLFTITLWFKQIHEVRGSNAQKCWVWCMSCDSLLVNVAFRHEHLSCSHVLPPVAFVIVYPQIKPRFHDTIVV